ncbi:retrovirus-related Pol polyprotein from transposon 17.6 [Trichonephila clavipes]|nr:retrovirus-related Pol polyprotein from transposon 17.6 [Trichonephila clavipes]
MIRCALKLSEFSIEWEHRPCTQNVVTDKLSRNPANNVERSQIPCAALRALALNSRQQLIQEQREDPELGHIIRYLKNPEDGSVNATLCEDLLDPYRASRPKRCRFILVTTDYFTQCSELIPLRKASVQAIAMALFENYISRYGAPISLISDNGPQFISDVFEYLSYRLDIKHIKTVTYRPRANLTERVDRTLVQMIACFVKENHDYGDRFLYEFSFTLRTAVNETAGKTPAELFLGRKIITPFRKLVLVTDGAEYVGGNIEKLFDDARQNMQRQHKTWEKYYNRKRRAINIKVNDLVLVQTHFISAAGRRVVRKFMPKFEGPYRVLAVHYNNLTIWKRRRRITLNNDQVRIYHPKNSEKSSYDSINETTYEGKESSNWSNRSNSKKSRRSRKPSGAAFKTRRTTGGEEEYGDRQPTTEQPQEKEPQCGSIGQSFGR